MTHSIKLTLSGSAAVIYVRADGRKKERTDRRTDGQSVEFMPVLDLLLHLHHQPVFCVGDHIVDIQREVSLNR
jgi:hypothetical protein